MNIKFYIALYIGKILMFIINIISKGRGTNMPGEMAYKIDKNFIKNFKKLNREKIVFVTGTNGKSTTNNMISHILKNSGRAIATNVAGANMVGGVATILLQNSNLKGEFNKEYLVLEIDERSLPRIYSFLKPKHICITNLQKDQVQRNGDPEFIYSKFENAIEKDTILYLNNDEPRSRGLESKVKKVVYYGIDKNEYTYERDDFYSVTMPCPKCNSKIKYNYYNLENIGNFECTKCDYKSNEKPDVFLYDINFEEGKFKCDDVEYAVHYKTPFYMYDYALSMAICRNFGLSEKEIQSGFDDFKNPADRKDILTYKDKQIHYYRMKQENPETLQSALDMIGRDKEEKAIFIGLFEIKDFEPHYTNTFYFFDCNIKEILKSKVEKFIVFSKSVCFDTANRLIYDGVNKEDIIIMNDDNVENVLSYMDKLETKNIYILTGMKPYKKIKEFLNKGGLENGKE